MKASKSISQKLIVRLIVDGRPVSFIALGVDLCTTTTTKSLLFFTAGNMADRRNRMLTFKDFAVTNDEVASFSTTIHGFRSLSPVYPQKPHDSRAP